MDGSASLTRWRPWASSVSRASREARLAQVVRRAEGKRRDHCPYEHLGLRLPTYDAWALLQMDPEELAQQLSTTKVAA